MKEKYYNVKEALDYIRSYPSGRIEKEFYMDITEKQIRDILKKDVLGQYKQLSEGFLVDFFLGLGSRQKAISL